MRFSVITLFPEFFKSPLQASLLGKAFEAGILFFNAINPREFGDGKHRTVDDTPYGGGAGMVMKPPVAEKTLASFLDVDALATDVQSVRAGAAPDFSKPYVVMLSPQGKPLTAATSRRLAKHKHLVLFCGHYEGVDERITDVFAHELVSIGDYVLTGGEPAALVLMDSIARFVPGVIGEMDSVDSDTFETSSKEMVPGGLKAPVYTKPQVWRGLEVPSVLLSGHHAEITKWRYAQSQERTVKRRPDLKK